ncbi:hypothetical protein EYF80_015416 [Liparis tanakae]|uniref:Uncharacterized protein n=1 Tax=Liparis tanakae TaxID=230148 RepID=A0A4Z2IB21_9TELE|nr:hypothetical protein EYF80_015416 [Liparis tanakae]
MTSKCGCGEWQLGTSFDWKPLEQKVSARSRMHMHAMLAGDKVMYIPASCGWCLQLVEGLNEGFEEAGADDKSISLLLIQLLLHLAFEHLGSWLDAPWGPVLMSGFILDPNYGWDLYTGSSMCIMKFVPEPQQVVRTAFRKQSDQRVVASQQLKMSLVSLSVNTPDWAAPLAKSSSAIVGIRIRYMALPKTLRLLSVDKRSLCLLWISNARGLSALCYVRAAQSAGAGGGVNRDTPQQRSPLQDAVAVDAVQLRSATRSADYGDGHHLPSWRGFHGDHTPFSVNCWHGMRVANALQAQRVRLAGGGGRGLAKDDHRSAGSLQQDVATRKAILAIGVVVLLDNQQHGRSLQRHQPAQAANGQTFIAIFLLNEKQQRHTPYVGPLQAQLTRPFPQSV